MKMKRDFVENKPKFFQELCFKHSRTAKLAKTCIVCNYIAASLSIDLAKHKSCHCTWEPTNIPTECASIPACFTFWTHSNIT